MKSNPSQWPAWDTWIHTSETYSRLDEHYPSNTAYLRRSLTYEAPEIVSALHRSIFKELDLMLDFLKTGKYFMIWSVCLGRWKSPGDGRRQWLQCRDELYATERDHIKMVKVGNFVLGIFYCTQKEQISDSKIISVSFTKLKTKDIFLC